MINFKYFTCQTSWSFTALSELIDVTLVASTNFTSLPRLVLETLGPVSQERKCFRMINGVLVERTVKDVVPALQTNLDGLKKVLDDLMKQYKTKQDEMDKWKVIPSCCA